jgi:NTE family protein
LQVATEKDPGIFAQHDHIALVLQGGGALGAYQAGVYEELCATGYKPEWIAGVSIGAINAALIAGNPPERRIERLSAFWHLISSGMGPVTNVLSGLQFPWMALHMDRSRSAFNQFSAFWAATLGIPSCARPWWKSRSPSRRGRWGSAKMK